MASYLQKLNEIILGILLVTLCFSAIANGTLLPTASLSLLEIHLVRTLTYISHRYFAPERTLVISSSSTYRDVQQELIAEIHRSSVFPVVVAVDGNVSNPERTDFVAEDGSNIIVITDGNIESFKEAITGLARDGDKWTRLWNSESRFVVAGANEFSMSQKTDIFDYFSMLRIYNCIIISREHYILDQEHGSQLTFKDVNTSTKLVVYTWFPYQSSDSCTEVNDITLLDSWVISAHGQFNKNTDLFPTKIRNNLKGCPMKTVARFCEWDFTTNYIQQQYANGSVVEVFGGLEMDLLMLVLKQMNVTFIHVPTPDGFECGDERSDNLITAMIAKEVYIAIGYVGTHFSFDPFLDVTNSYYMMSVRWYVPCSFKNPRWSSVFRILSVELWLVLIISILIAAISTTLVGRYSCTSEWQVYKTLTSSLTNIWAVILGVAVSSMPRSSSLRLLFLGWVCFSVAFSTVFQAFLTTFLINSGYRTPIQNMDELFASGIKFAYPPVYGYLFEDYNEMEALHVEGNLADCPSYVDCYLSAMRHKNASIMFADIDAEEKYAKGIMLDENSEPSLCGLEDGLVYNDGLRIAMLQGDPLMKRFNEIIDRVFEANLYNYWISREMNLYKIYSRKIAVVHPLDGYQSFNLYHIQTAFYLLLMGCCLGVLCFMFELLYNLVLRIRF